MERKRNVGFLLSAVGIITGIIFATADLIGLGTHASFGPIQIVGIIVGGIILIIGLVMAYRK